MKKKIIVLLLMALLLLSSFDIYASEPYRLRPGDVLVISVYNIPEYNRKNGKIQHITIRPDGCISLEFIGDIMCNDKSIDELSEIISHKLKDYIINPKVMINLIKLGTVKVYVFGETKNQGIFYLTKTHTLLDAISAANGFKETSSKKNIYVIKTNSSNYKFIKVNFNKFLTEGKVDENLVLADEDCVYITNNNKFKINDILPYLRAYRYGQEVKEN